MQARHVHKQWRCPRGEKAWELWHTCDRVSVALPSHVHLAARGPEAQEAATHEAQRGLPWDPLAELTLLLHEPQ